jgi:hypothetical protein
VDVVLSYSPHGSVVPDGTPLPRWSWNGLEADPAG